MPHLIIHTTKAGREALANVAMTLDEFVEEVEGCVAEVFNKLLGAQLVAGQTVKTDGCHGSETMPVDIHVTILAWHTARRARAQDELAGALKEVISKKVFAILQTPPSLQLHLNIVG